MKPSISATASVSSNSANDDLGVVGLQTATGNCSWPRVILVPVRGLFQVWIVSIAVVALCGQAAGQTNRVGRVRPSPPSIPSSAVQISAKPTKGVAPLTVEFKAVVGSALAVKDDYLRWDFGDHTKGQGTSVRHEYRSEGTYTVNLIYNHTFIDGGFVTNAKPITINVLAPSVNRSSSGEGFLPGLMKAILQSVTNPTPLPPAVVLTNHPSRPQAELRLFPSQLTFAGREGEPEPEPQALTISNTGKVSLRWRLGQETASWIQAGVVGGFLSAGQSAQLSVAVRSEGLPVGANQGQIFIIISSRGTANSPVVAAVIFNLAAKPVPTAFTPIKITPDNPPSSPTPPPPKWWMGRSKDPLVWGFFAYIAGTSAHRFYKRRLVRVKPHIEPGVQRIHALMPLLSEFVYIKVKYDVGVSTVHVEPPLIAKPQLTGDRRHE